MEKNCNTGKTEGKHREFYLGSNVATLTLLFFQGATNAHEQCTIPFPVAKMTCWPLYTFPVFSNGMVDWSVKAQFEIVNSEINMAKPC